MSKVDTRLYIWYKNYMKKAKELTKALLFHFPISLVEKLEKSAKENQRSVVKEVIWRLLQSYVLGSTSKLS